jgi:hypothetical protein
MKQKYCVSRVVLFCQEKVYVASSEDEAIEMAKNDKTWGAKTDLLFMGVDEESYELSEPQEETAYDMWQPEFDKEGNIIGHESDPNYIASFAVYRSKENLLRDYPNANPIGYFDFEIEDPTFLD